MKLDFTTNDLFCYLLVTKYFVLLFGRRAHRWEDNIKMDVKETGWEVVHLVHLAQDRGQ
jgi:hypothetical protein